jgi:gliding motility-associated-like protein
MLTIYTKYDGNGNVLWAKSPNGNYQGESWSVSADQSGNCYVAGYFSGPSINFGTVSLNGGPLKELFLVKYDQNGNALWGTGDGNSGADDGACSVSTTRTGDVYITGTFNKSTMTLGSTNLTNSGISSIYIAKFDGSGSLIWAKTPVDPGGGGSSGLCVAADPYDNVYLSGPLESTMLIFGIDTLTCPSNTDQPMYIAKYDQFGNGMCASALTSGGESLSGLATDLSGNAYIGGGFEYVPFVLGPDTLQVTEEEIAFIAKYQCCPTFIPPQHLTTKDGQSLVLHGNGTGTFSWSPAIDLSCTNCQNPTASPKTGITYTYTVTGAAGCPSIIGTVTVNILEEAIVAPNVFSPNGDQVNDIWIPIINNLWEISSYHCVIFDRWGRNLYETANQSFGWDGRADTGLECTSGTYYYLIEASSVNSLKETNSWRLKGFIELTR